MSKDPEFRRRALAIVAAAEVMGRPDGDEGDDFIAMDADALATEIVEAYEAHGRSPAGGAPSYLADHPRLVRLLRALAAGNYRETAADLAMIHPRTLQLWCERGEKEPETVYGVVYRIIRHAEAVAEASARHRIAEAGKAPHLWAANAWGLERKHPDRWARKAEDNNAPRVIVQIGVGADDIRVGHRNRNGDEISVGAHKALAPGACADSCLCRSVGSVVEAEAVSRVAEAGSQSGR
ncbi:MAG TPA: hypothetical protein VM364_05815 [Vicinamibacterales bacterium]|nr:hypothetical protein [Vicinamibacterales bacterium]